MTEGFARKGFDGDLLDGQVAEDAFARILLGGKEKWEHKSDGWFATTGNIAVEWQTSELPNGEGRCWLSGISVCKAHWWVVEYLPNKRLLWPTEDVKELARRAIRQKRCKWCGDHNRFHNALVPGAWFMEAEARLAEAA